MSTAHVLPPYNAALETESSAECANPRAGRYGCGVALPRTDESESGEGRFALSNRDGRLALLDMASEASVRGASEALFDGIARGMSMGMSPYLRALREAVGPRLLVLPSVTGVVFDDQRRVLLVQQRDVRRNCHGIR